MSAAAGEEEHTELELEAAAILCDLKRILRARDRRRRRRMRRLEQQQQLQQGGDEEAPPVIPSWGRRRLRSVLEDGGKPAAERDGAASPDTPLAFFPEEEDDGEARKARAQDEWVQEQRGVVANLSQENADLHKQIEEYRARLLTSRTANESLKQLHKVRQQERTKMRVLAIPIPHRPSAALGLDLNAPADDVEEAAARARAAAAAQQQQQQQQQRYWQAQQLHKAAATAEARRRRLEILRAKVASPLVSCRTPRRVVG
ncbi:hypothetical protein QOZ80_2BG0153120 [Eleusine coracana subsp. coracana]|nr:hypothetical protein QOZ80_2BG0153120 [Eleusine coracana subsp. coracana]